MDVFSHAFWGTVFFARTRGLVFWAILFSMLPDIIPFGPNILIKTMGMIFGERQDLYLLPGPVATLYNYTHSLVVVVPLYFLFKLWKEEISYAFLAWPLHILLDIPTHSKDYFPTKFLYPISEYHISGIYWRNPYYLFFNYLAVFLLIFIISYKRRTRENKK